MKSVLVGWLNMNSKGQVLVLFVLIIPILILGAAYIVDNVYISYHTNRLNNINSLVIKDAVMKELDEEQIVEYVNQNDENINTEIRYYNFNLKITLTKRIKSIFGRIVGKNYYDLTSIKSLSVVNN